MCSEGYCSCHVCIAISLHEQSFAPQTIPRIQRRINVKTCDCSVGELRRENQVNEPICKLAQAYLTRAIWQRDTLAMRNLEGPEVAMRGVYRLLHVI